MYVLVPDDPVFMTKFLAMEDPLLHSLYYFYLSDLPPEQAEVIRAAYDSWGNIQKRLPPRLHWQELTAHGARQWQHAEGYALRSPCGKRLTCLYIVEISAEYQSRLTACHSLLAQAEIDAGGPLTHALRDIWDQDQNLVENFRRVLDVLQLQAPPRLLESVRRGMSAGSGIEITIDAIQEEEYVSFCDHIVHALSAGDRFNYTMHREIYL